MQVACLAMYSRHNIKHKALAQAGTNAIPSPGRSSGPGQNCCPGHSLFRVGQTNDFKIGIDSFHVQCSALKGQYRYVEQASKFTCCALGRGT